MDQVIVASLALAQEFARKSASMPLTEYEMLLYEQCCRAAQAYLRSLENVFKSNNKVQEEKMEDVEDMLEKLNDLKREGGEDGEATSNVTK